MQPVLGHNIPDDFWIFVKARGLIYNSGTKVYADVPLLNRANDLGYRITEPHWSNVHIAGARKWVLVQAFQRRVLTYVADNQPSWQLEMGNAGRHYFDWRYGQ